NAFKLYPVPIDVGGIVEREPGKSGVPIDGSIRTVRAAIQYGSVLGFIIANDLLCLVSQDRIARMNFDAIVAGARVYPDGLLHGGTDDNVVVSAQSVDNDGEEVAFRREQPAQSARSQRSITIL